MTDTALIVIDVQESFKHRPYWTEDDLPIFQTQLLSLIRIARQKNWQVVYVLHEEESGAFSQASGFVRLMDFLQPQANEAIFTKQVHNALTNSGLQAWLQERGISHLKISGIRTEQCCETTARVASDFGYQVDYVLDATLTFAMQHPLEERIVTPEQIKAHTALVLQDRFAQITFVDNYA
jgi:nicotinamidase-related amidase